jgi:predicted enzyme related to lactoylglutathione lyase
VAYAVDDLAAWRAHLEAAGVAILENTPIPGYARCMLRDPFGNHVELIAAL